MSYHVLRLRTLMNRPERVALSESLMTLDEEDPPALLVLDEAQVKSILKSEAIEPYDLVGYWKVAARLPGTPLPAIESFFKKTPILLHGQEHRDVRRALTPCYRRIEVAMDSWLPDFIRAFFSTARARSGLQNIAAIPFVSAFLDALNRTLIAQDLKCQADSLPVLPNKLFSLLQRSDALMDYDARLACLVHDLAARLSFQQRDPEEAWALVSIAVMGQEPLLAGLLYGLAHRADGGQWTAESLMRMAAPVSMLVGRQVLADVTVDGHPLRQGQTVYICPFLSHRSMDAQAPAGQATSSLSFGMGPHLCAGRTIALKIVQGFLDGLQQFPDLSMDCRGLRFSRDINLQVDKTHD